jgi:hypothetical protein
MPALRQRFFHDTAATMTELAQFGGARGNFEQGAARACNGASEPLYKHPWGSQSYALAILLLPRFVRDLFHVVSTSRRKENNDAFYPYHLS